MTHLTVDEILDFVSLPELNKDAMELSAAVNGHIRNCEYCLKSVRAFQMIYDEFVSHNRGGDPKEYIQKTTQAYQVNQNTIEPQIALDELEGF